MKIKKINYCTAISLMLGLLFCLQTAHAQYAHFIQSGKIEFERKVNMYAKLKDRSERSPFMKKLYEAYRKDQPQFYTSKSTLSFSKDKSIYQFLEAGKLPVSFLSSDPWVTIKSTVQHDFNTDSVVALKEVYDENFVIKDKKQDIIWKITTETREIAGYQCRRANGLILDSIYVVAFYADEIVPAGGPESFSGLPGMILGVAIPHENVTWFATKVEIDKPLPATPPKLPKKVEEVSRSEYEASLKKSTKNWGEWGEDAMKAFML